jgi:hypothetical protein
LSAKTTSAFQETALYAAAENGKLPLPSLSSHLEELGMMRWPTALLLAAFCAAGCHSAQPTLDPFLPRTRIPPPATGAATGAPDANYTNPAPPMTGGAPAWPAPANPPAAGPGNLYAPPGGYQYPQPTPAPGASNYPPASTGTPLSKADDTPAIGQIPRAKPTKYVATADTAPSAVYERGQPDAAGDQPELASNDESSAVDIMDLPPVSHVARAE